MAQRVDYFYLFGFLIKSVKAVNSTSKEHLILDGVRVAVPLLDDFVCFLDKATSSQLDLLYQERPSRTRAIVQSLQEFAREFKTEALAIMPYFRPFESDSEFVVQALQRIAASKQVLNLSLDSSPLIDVFLLVIANRKESRAAWLESWRDHMDASVLVMERMVELSASRGFFSGSWPLWKTASLFLSISQ